MTKEDPLHGLNGLTKQVFLKGIKEVNGDMIIDESLFETILKRDMMITPILINENFIDIVINPTAINEKATITWRPQVSGYTIENHLKTAPKDEQLSVTISSDDLGQNIQLHCSGPIDQQNIVRTFSIKTESLLHVQLLFNP